VKIRFDRVNGVSRASGKSGICRVGSSCCRYEYCATLSYVLPCMMLTRILRISSSLLQGSYKGVTRVLQERYKSVAKVLHACYKHVTMHDVNEGLENVIIVGYHVVKTHVA
jgi:hypothetical protein